MSRVKIAISIFLCTPRALLLENIEAKNAEEITQLSRLPDEAMIYARELAKIAGGEKLPILDPITRKFSLIRVPQIASP